MQGLAADKIPEIAVKRSKLLLNVQKRACIAEDGVYLKAVAHNTGIRHKALSAPLVTPLAIGGLTIALIGGGFAAREAGRLTDASLSATRRLQSILEARMILERFAHRLFAL